VGTFVRQNKAALGTVVVAFALLTGTAVSAWQASRATKAETLAESVWLSVTTIIVCAQIAAVRTRPERILG
jgi:hypothetical protein